MQVLSEPRLQWEDNQHDHRYHIQLQKELHMPKLKLSLCNNLSDLQNTICWTNKKNNFEDFQGHHVNTNKALRYPDHTPGTNLYAHKKNKSKVAQSDYTVPKPHTRASETLTYKSWVSSLSTRTVRGLRNYDAKRRNSGYIDSDGQSHKDLVVAGALHIPVRSLKSNQKH